VNYRSKRRSTSSLLSSPRRFERITAPQGEIEGAESLQVVAGAAYMVAKQGLMKSTDHGLTWKMIYSTAEEAKKPPPATAGLSRQETYF
jgi:hypothetical protein